MSERTNVAEIRSQLLICGQSGSNWASVTLRLVP